MLASRLGHRGKEIIMVNHSNRSECTADTLRSVLVPVSKKIKNGEFSKIDKFFGERVIFVASWKSRVVYTGIVRGAYGPTGVREGDEEIFELKHMLSKEINVEKQIGFNFDDRSKNSFDKIYQEYLINEALTAQEILDNLPAEEDITDQVKQRIRDVLRPYISQYEYN